jgi:hypothetical protein
MSLLHGTVGILLQGRVSLLELRPRTTVLDSYLISFFFVWILIRFVVQLGSFTEERLQVLVMLSNIPELYSLVY